MSQKTSSVLTQPDTSDIPHYLEWGAQEEERVLSIFRRSILPPKKVKMWEWAEQNLFIPRRSGTPHPGPYRTSVTPWVRGWFDMLQDPDIHTVVLETGAQVSKTTTAMAFLCYCMAMDPDPILYAMPSGDMAATLSVNRLLPMIEESPSVRACLSGNRYDTTAMEYKTRDTVVRFIGLLSPGNTASFPHRYVIIDEPDKIIRENIGREGDVLQLLMARSRQFWNRKRLIVCTPTTEQGYVHRYFLLGDQRRYFVPCPLCGHHQVLVWPRVMFDSKLSPADAGASAWYKCEKCDGRIEDRHRAWMTANGEWRATASPKRPGYASAHLSSLYSNSDECSMSALVEKFLSVKDNASELREFVNQDLAEIWTEKPRSAVERGHIWSIRDRKKYRRGTIPLSGGGFILAIVADVQDAILVWTVWALSMRDVALVDHGTCTSFDDLRDISQRTFPDQDGNGHVVFIQGVDTGGHRTEEVYNYCLNSSLLTIPIKGDTGASTTQTAPVRSSKLTAYPNGKPMPRGRCLVLRHLHPLYFRDILTKAMSHIELQEGDTMDVAVERLPVRLWLHEEVDLDFVDQLTAEPCVEDPPDKYGMTRRYYKKLRRNDYFDCAHYAIAIKYMLHATLLERSGAAPKNKTSVTLPPKEKGDEWTDKWDDDDEEDGE